MSVLVPAAAFLGLTIPAILALYFLRIRRPTRVVPALHLWPDQIRDRQANVPWQRLRPSWLLFLQLLAPQETAPDWSGDARLKDAESGLEREFTSTPVTQAAYLKALARRSEEIEQAAHRRGLRFARLSTSQPLEEMVSTTLRQVGLLG